MTSEREPLLDTTTRNRVYDTTDNPSTKIMKREKDNPKAKTTSFNQGKLNIGEETCDLYAYKETIGRQILFWLLTIVTLGFYQLLAYWVKSLFVKVRFQPTSHDECEYVMVEDIHGTQTIKEVFKAESDVGLARPTRSGKQEKVKVMRFFTYRKIKYIWYEKDQEWLNPADMDSAAPFNIYQKLTLDVIGLKEQDVIASRKIYNMNALALALTPILVILFKEVLGPFYLFQCFSVALWYSDNYAYYASVIVIITVGSAAVAVYQMRAQEKRIRNMVGDTISVIVRRDGHDITIDASEIVPMDILILPSNTFILPCDCLLMNGTVIVNEAMLTGESVPVTKASLKEADECGPEIRLSSEHNRHTLFSGTTVLQTRNYKGQPVMARVIRTGFSTLKGQLVRSIMYPKPQEKEALKDVMVFILVLGFIALIGFIYTVIEMVSRGESLKHIIIRSLDIITIVVPPALPAAMSVGIINANSRLKKKKIFCTSPTTVNVCGLINVACFDKTGTLTEDGLDFNCLKAIRKNEDGKPEFTSEFEELDPVKLSAENANLNIVVAAASCHSLTRIDGTLHGDPLELILVEKSKWIIEEAVNSDEETQDFDTVQPTVLRPPPEQATYHPENNEYSVIKQHPFNSALQRMSVIISTPSEHSAHDMMVFTKGSPEMIASLCIPDTIPEDYMEVVDEYAQRGFRLIAVASKAVHLNFAKALKTPRDIMESELEFLGLIVMENRLKDVTLSVINELSVANIRCVMVTGDNLLTAMSVARECGIIRPTKKAFLITHSKTEKDPLGRTKLFIKESVSSSENDIDTDSEVRAFDRKAVLRTATYQMAIAGPTYSVITHEYPELVDRITAMCDVYARMAPDQKAQLIGALQEIGAKVSMCGDGANDCAALKAAHAGISLSQAEASIAAPFTSNVPDIRCVPTVIKEGRCALVTSYAVSKYMAAYSLNEFLSVMLLYNDGTNISDGQFLYIDLVLITLVALFLGNTEASRKLSGIPPPRRLATSAFYFSVFGQMFFNIITQTTGYLLVRGQSWYVPNPEELDNTTTMIGTTVFFTSCCMYLGYAFVYSKGHPYRRSVFTNWLLCGIIFVIGAINMVMIFTNMGFLMNLMGFVYVPSTSMRFILLAISLAGVFLSLLYEHFFVEKVVAIHFESYLRQRRLRNGDPSLSAYEKILAAIGSSPRWFEDEINLSKSIDRKETIESKC
ncbi:Cation-transporting ATPase [Caenorhabditis elegans]|uniref:Cation-transporting ATPase n=1 Tax=Caenorhabditis elegans TaxID=6239 RepID=A0A131MBX4_CAEEL|nr:Cation-transporting ATPase [Caenorhabditis elegans]CZR14628.1 Cation-transporting ATPase [Caenorhabditis elegans]|eukprot:NP_001309699.1 Cation-transporting ATPase [Caenorhabditis elegans]